MHARIDTFTVPAERLDDVVRIFQDHAVPASISLWTTRAARDAGMSTGRRWIAAGGELGAAIVGEPQILEQAFDARPR
jgi:hypothetical protein